MILSIDTIRSRRLALGLSVRAFARAVGVSPMTVTALENGRNHEDLSLRLVCRIAAALDLELASLLERPEEQPSGPDDVIVEAALAELGRLVHRDELARALEWDIARLAAALERLERRLIATGQRLRTRGANVALATAPEVLTGTQQTALAHAKQAAAA